MTVHDLSTMNHHSDFIRFYYILTDFELIPNSFSGPIIQFLNPLGDLTPRYEAPHIDSVFLKLSLQTLKSKQSVTS